MKLPNNGWMFPCYLCNTPTCYQVGIKHCCRYCQRQNLNIYVKQNLKCKIIPPSIFKTDSKEKVKVKVKKKVIKINNPVNLNPIITDEINDNLEITHLTEIFSPTEVLREIIQTDNKKDNKKDNKTGKDDIDNILDKTPRIKKSKSLLTDKCCIIT